MAWKDVASDPFHHHFSRQGCPTQSMTTNHIKGRWNLKKYVQRVFSRLILRYFRCQKEVARATNQVPNTLDGDKRCFFII